jgi:hypothetical protein
MTYVNGLETDEGTNRGTPLDGKCSYPNVLRAAFEQKAYGILGEMGEC